MHIANTMRLFTVSYLTLGLFSIALASFTEHKIDHFGQILNYTKKEIETLKTNGVLNPEKKVLVVLDWDRTISKLEGGQAPWPLSESKGTEEAPSTKETIAEFNKLGVRVIVLTARGQGREFETNVVAGIAENMKESASLEGSTATNPEWLLKKGAKPGERVVLTLPNGDQFMVTERAIFAGSRTRGNTSKAPALAHLIDENAFKTKPESIVFADNSNRHMKGFQAVFADRPEKVIGLYYPKFGDEDR